MAKRPKLQTSARESQWHYLGFIVREVAAGDGGARSAASGAKAEAQTQAQAPVRPAKKGRK